MKAAALAVLALLVLTFGAVPTATGAGTFNGDWYNLRGVAYPWQALIYAPDQSGAPSPEWSFAQFRSLGWNLIRMDEWSWGKYNHDPTTFLSNVDRVTSAANANGVYIVVAFSVLYGDQPDDVKAAVPVSSWQTLLQSDGAYPGSNPILPVMGIWEAMFKGFVGPVIQHIDSQPCVLGYKFINEPSWSNLGQLAKFYGVMGSATRALGSQKYLTYEGFQGGRGNAGFITQILPYSSNFRPAVYDMHYPSVSEIATDSTAATANGVALWVGEVYAGWNNAAFVQALQQGNAASTIYRWDEDGNLLVHWTGGQANAPPTGTLTSTATSLSIIQTQILGPAMFFGGVHTSFSISTSSSTHTQTTYTGTVGAGFTQQQAAAFALLAMAGGWFYLIKKKRR